MSSITEIDPKLIYKSKYTDINIPNQKTLTEVILGNPLNYESLDHPAFIDANTDEAITHKELREIVDKLSSGLRNTYGVGHGDVVGLFAPNHIHYATCMLAVTNLGAILSPVNYAYTSTEVQHLMEKVNPKVLFTVPDLYETAKLAMVENLSNCKILLLDTKRSEKCESIPCLTEILSDKPFDKLEFKTSTQSQETIAAILFSSGTTGLPKGVKLSHFNLISNALQVTEIIKFHQPLTKFIAVLPFFHCYAMIADMFSNCLYLCSMKILPKFDLKKFLTIVQEDKIENGFLAPPVIVAITKHPLVANFDISSLKHIISGAAPLSKEIELELKEKYGVICSQGYGMTEMSPVTHVLPIGISKPGSIGNIVPNMEAILVDVDTGKPVGPNERGELRMRGPNLMMGYYNNDEATNDIYDEYGFMRTGDIGYCNDDGFFFVVDRLKELIKVKGFQVPPAELEAVLLTHPLVADACVIGVKIDSDTEAPKGYITLKNPQAPNQEEIIQDILDYVHSKVAHYKKLTGGLSVIPQIPKSTAGKLLRKELVKLNVQKSPELK